MRLCVRKDSPVLAGQGWPCCLFCGEGLLLPNLFVPLVSLSAFVPAPCCPNCYDSITALISGSTSLQPCSLFSQSSWLFVPWPFAFSYKFYISLSISTQNNPTGIVIEVAVSVAINRGVGGGVGITSLQ